MKKQKADSWEVDDDDDDLPTVKMSPLNQTLKKKPA